MTESEASAGIVSLAELVLDALDAPLVLTDRAGVVLFQNAAAQRVIFGCPPCPGLGRAHICGFVDRVELDAATPGTTWRTPFPLGDGTSVGACVVALGSGDAVHGFAVTLETMSARGKRLLHRLRNLHTTISSAAFLLQADSALPAAAANDVRQLLDASAEAAAMTRGSLPLSAGLPFRERDD